MKPSAVDVITGVLTSTINTGNEMEPVDEVYKPEGVAVLIRNALLEAGHLAITIPLLAELCRSRCHHLGNGGRGTCGEVVETANGQPSFVFCGHHILAAMSLGDDGDDDG